MSFFSISQRSNQIPSLPMNLSSNSYMRKEYGNSSFQQDNKYCMNSKNMEHENFIPYKPKTIFENNLENSSQGYFKQNNQNYSSSCSVHPNFKPFFFQSSKQKGDKYLMHQENENQNFVNKKENEIVDLELTKKNLCEQLNNEFNSFKNEIKQIEINKSYEDIIFEVFIFIFNLYIYYIKINQGLETTLSPYINQFKIISKNVEKELTTLTTVINKTNLNNLKKRHKAINSHFGMILTTIEENLAHNKEIFEKFKDSLTNFSSDLAQEQATEKKTNQKKKFTKKK